MTETEYLGELARFAEELAPHGALLDEDAGATAEWYREFESRGLHVRSSPLQPLSGRGFCDALAICSRVSGSFGFLLLQQLVGNGFLSSDPRTTAWPRVGVAFGHLRRLDGPSPIWENGRVNGFVPWLTGSHIFEQVILGVRGPDGLECFALVPTADRAEFVHSSPLSLVACRGTSTVSVQVRNLALDANQLLAANPRGHQRDADAGSVLYQTPLMVGCVESCLALIKSSERVDGELKRRCEARCHPLLERVREAFDRGDSTNGPEVRAELGDLSCRVARLAVMAAGGTGLLLTHPAQRLYREALLYSSMAQTDVIVNQAFEEVLS